MTGTLPTAQRSRAGLSAEVEEDLAAAVRAAAGHRGAPR